MREMEVCVLGSTESHYEIFFKLLFHMHKMYVYILCVSNV